MKTTFTILIILITFSSYNINAQELSIKKNNSEKTSIITTQKTAISKVSFYKELIAKNNFDIKIKDTSNLAIRTKIDYYHLLLEKANLNTDSKHYVRFAVNHLTKDDVAIKTANLVVGVTP